MTTRKYREGEYEKLIDAVYPKRGWNLNGVPTIATPERAWHGSSGAFGSS